MANHQELVGALLELARMYLLFLPAVFLPSNTLPPLLHWATAAVQLRESEPVSHAAAFLSVVITPPSSLTASALWQVCLAPCALARPFQDQTPNCMSQEEMSNVELSCVGEVAIYSTMKAPRVTSWYDLDRVRSQVAYLNSKLPNHVLCIVENAYRD